MRFQDFLNLFNDSNSNQLGEQQSLCSLGRLSSWNVHSVGFGGIAVVTLKSFGAALLMLLAFLFMRKVWNFGRVALVYDADSYLNSTYQMPSPVHKGLDEDQGFCSWIRAVFRSRYSIISDRCGEDALHYLSFQRHLIYFFFFASIIALCALIPINVKGATSSAKAGYFQQTTLANVESQEVFLWIHFSFAVILSVSMICFMRKHSFSICYRDIEKVENSIFINGLPPNAAEETIKQYFSEAYPTCKVDSIHLCHDVSKLMKTSLKRRKASKSLAYYTHLHQNNGQKVNITPTPCTSFCCCSTCGGQPRDAVEYYASMKNELQEEYKKQLQAAHESHIGMAYVTFSEKSMAKLILKDFSAILCRKKPHTSVTDQLEVSRWSVSGAPYPEDILWGNMSVRGWKWWVRFLCINILLLVLMLFLTTPERIVSTLDTWGATKVFHTLNRAFKYFPNLQLWAFSLVLRVVVHHSTPYEAHWLKSAENKMMLYKMFSYLTFIVLIAPSLNLWSVYHLLQWVFKGMQDVNASGRLECLFRPHQGAVVQYVIIAAILANAVDLVRIPEFLHYVARMAFAKRAADRQHIMQTQAEYFPFGEMYANMLCIVTLVMAYSNLCPLVVPLGLLYLLIRHVVDMHNLYFVHLPSKQHEGVHEAAVRLSMAAPIVCLLWLFIFCVLRRGLTPLTVTQALVLLIAIMTYLIRACYSFDRHLFKPSHEMEESYPTSPATRGEEVLSQQYPVYVPSVIINIEMEEEPLNTSAITSPVELCNFYKNYP